MIRSDNLLRARWGVVFHILAGTLGAYALTSLATAALSLIMTALGMERLEAVTAATLASFAIFTGIAIATFHARSASRAWGWLSVISVPLGLLLWLLLP